MIYVYFECTNACMRIHSTYCCVAISIVIVAKLMYTKLLNNNNRKRSSLLLLPIHPSMRNVLTQTQTRAYDESKCKSNHPFSVHSEKPDERCILQKRMSLCAKMQALHQRCFFWRMRTNRTWLWMICKQQLRKGGFEILAWLARDTSAKKNDMSMTISRFSKQMHAETQLLVGSSRWFSACCLKNPFCSIVIWCSTWRTLLRS